MGVNVRTGGCADDLASDRGVADEALVARVLDAVRAAGAVADTRKTSQSEVIDIDHGHRTTERVLNRVPEGEIAALQRLAKREGQPQAARRVAELLELNGETDVAAQWWLLAASLGDEDATAYVAHCLQR